MDDAVGPLEDDFAMRDATVVVLRTRPGTFGTVEVGVELVTPDMEEGDSISQTRTLPSLAAEITHIDDFELLSPEAADNVGRMALERCVTDLW
jgi:hypothetical protein